MSAKSLVPYRQCSADRASAVGVASNAEQCGYGTRDLALTDGPKLIRGMKPVYGG
jgi:hypothetical protein